METLRWERRDGVGWIFFNCPEVRNAVNLRMMDELEEWIEQWGSDPTFKVLVFAGDEKAFVSGGDLEEFRRLTTEEAVFPVMARMGRLLEKVRSLGKPTVAAVRGTAVGGGCEIAASCDFRVASQQAVFGFVQSRLGITTGWGGGSRLFEQLPKSQALYLLLSGKRVDARLLQQWGWIIKLFPEENFLTSVQSFAQELAQAPAEVIKAYMEMASGGWVDPVDREARYCARLWETEEHLRAMDAFLNRS